MLQLSHLAPGQVTMPQRPAPPQPSHAVLVDRGLGGSFLLRWAPHDEGAIRDVKALDYEVYWTVPGEDAADAGMRTMLSTTINGGIHSGKLT